MYFTKIFSLSLILEFALESLHKLSYNKPFRFATLVLCLFAINAPCILFLPSYECASFPSIILTRGTFAHPNLSNSECKLFNNMIASSSKSILGSLSTVSKNFLK